MNTTRSYTLLVICLASFMGVMASCQDQGKRYSYGQVSATAYNEKTESLFDKLLQRYVDEANLVAYEPWIKNSDDIAKFKSVLDSMAKADDSAMSGDQKKAFYINAYNAMTLNLILSHYDDTMGSGILSPYPHQRSIRNISNLNAKVWDNFKWTIAGKVRSLNDVENKILRPMGDAHIHLAINCASMGCPPLHRHAFVASTLNQTLDDLAVTFVNGGKKTKFDTQVHVIHTSAILNWFGEDFAKTFGSVNAFFVRYVTIVSPQEVANYSVEFDDYDWTLNESKAELSMLPTPTPSPSPSPGSGTENEVVE